MWLNLLLLVIAIATFAYAKVQRDAILKKTAILFQPSPANPAEVNRIRDELSEMDVTQSQMEKELDGRLAYLQSIKSSQFYLAVDTTKRKLYFRLGDDVVREADVTIGEQKTFKAPNGKTWTFVPVKGAFTVVDKETDYAWPVADWVYASRGENPPADRPSIPNGLGKYVIILPDNYVIHTPPPDASPLHGTAKPGSIMVPEADLAAIWPRISKDTHVYIF